MYCVTSAFMIKMNSVLKIFRRLNKYLHCHIFGKPSSFSSADFMKTKLCINSCCEYPGLIVISFIQLNTIDVSSIV